MTVPSLDQSALQRELRELDDDRRDWFRLVATATAEALADGRSCVVTTNNAKIFDCLKRLAQHLGVSAEIVERDGLTDLIFRPLPRRKDAVAKDLAISRGSELRLAFSKAQPGSAHECPTVRAPGLGERPSCASSLRMPYGARSGLGRAAIVRLVAANALRCALRAWESGHRAPRRCRQSADDS
jgi:hypothetical protein